MIGGVVAAGVSVIAGIIWWYQIALLHRSLADPIVTFGKREDRSLSAEERQWILSGLVRQERWAFGLVWFAVAIGGILGSTLLIRVVFAGQMNASDVTSMVVVAGDITVATGAFRLYKIASKQLVEAIRTLH